MPIVPYGIPGSVPAVLLFSGPSIYFVMNQLGLPDLAISSGKDVNIVGY